MYYLYYFIMRKYENNIKGMYALYHVYNYGQNILSYFLTHAW